MGRKTALISNINRLRLALRAVYHLLMPECSHIQQNNSPSYNFCTLQLKKER
jgi:hypothetical protein